MAGQRNEQYAQLASELLTLAKQNDSSSDVSNLLLRCKNFLENLEDKPVAGGGGGVDANGGGAGAGGPPAPVPPPSRTDAGGSSRPSIFGALPESQRQHQVSSTTTPVGNDEDKLKRILLDLAQDPQAMNAYLSGGGPKRDEPPPRRDIAPMQAGPDRIQSMLQGIMGNQRGGRDPYEMQSAGGRMGGGMMAGGDMMGGGGMGGPQPLNQMPMQQQQHVPPRPAYGGGGGAMGYASMLAPAPRPAPYNEMASGGYGGGGGGPQRGAGYGRGYGAGGGGGGGYNEGGGYPQRGYGQGAGYGRDDANRGYGRPPQRPAAPQRGPPVQPIKEQKGFMWYVGPRCSLIEFTDRYGEARYVFAENQGFKGDGEGPERGQYVVFGARPNFREVKNNKWRFEVNSEWDALSFHPDPDRINENASSDRQDGGKAPGPMRQDRGRRREPDYKKKA